MALIIEIVLAIVLFTVLIVSLTLKNPLTSVGDYPPAIRARCIELGLIERQEQRFTKQDILRKAIALIVFAFLLKHVNGTDTFWQGFRDAYLIWLAINWYDTLILDCIWFCHSKRVRIPGTEDMEEYKDYAFHIKQSCVGMLLGLPTCLAVEIIVTLI